MPARLGAQPEQLLAERAEVLRLRGVEQPQRGEAVGQLGGERRDGRVVAVARRLPALLSRDDALER